MSVNAGFPAIRRNKLGFEQMLAEQEKSPIGGTRKKRAD